MQPLRSIQYIPANREQWVVDAPDASSADGFIFDLEDAVPASSKASARTTLADGLSTFSDPAQTIAVRVNGPETGFFEEDLDVVVNDVVDALVVPKLSSARDVTRVANVLDYLETIRGIQDSIELIALPETAAGFRRAHDLCTASDRVSALVGATSRGADVERALGFEWTASGEERQYMLSKLAMDGRAADISQILAGPWLDVNDLEGLREEARWCRQLGCTGFQVIHPSHAEPVNEIFTPDQDAIDRARDLLEAIDLGEANERGAVRHEGEMVDLAHVRRARDLVERAESFE